MIFNVSKTCLRRKNDPTKYRTFSIKISFLNFLWALDVCINNKIEIMEYKLCYDRHIWAPVEPFFFKLVRANKALDKTNLK